MIMVVVAAAVVVVVLGLTGCFLVEFDFTPHQ